MVHYDTDVLVIGAGPAGACSAAMLHRAGHRVRVVEKERFPRFVIGESLLPRCLGALEQAGLLPAAASRGYIVKHGAYFLRGDERAFFDFGDGHTAGWEYAWQVPREDFDATLAGAVAAMGVPVEFATAVRSVRLAPDDCQVDLEDGRAIRARFVVDASGYGRVLPRLLGLDRPSSFPVRKALFTHVTGDRREEGRMEGRIWVCIHPAGFWLWIIPFADGRTSVGAVGSEHLFAPYLARHADEAAALRAIIADEPNACARLAGCPFLWAPRTLAGYSASVDRLWGPGFCLVGNATEFLDPVFSSGVTLALDSAQRAAGVVDAQLRGEAVDWDAAYERPTRAGIDVFRTYVSGWYDGTFQKAAFAAEPDPMIRRMITSVLAGYVHDPTNPFVAQHRRKLAQVARIAS